MREYEVEVVNGDIQTQGPFTGSGQIVVVVKHKSRGRYIARAINTPITNKGQLAECFEALARAIRKDGEF